MSTDSDGPGDERLERLLREWGRRPPATEPGIAARRVVARLQGDRSRPIWGRALLATAGAALALTTVWQGMRMIEPSTPPGRRLVDEAPAPLPDNVVQWWLDAETPVYFVTGPLTPRRGE